MDPTLKEYLDRMSRDTAALRESVDSNAAAMFTKQESMSQQIASQSAQLTDLCGWKPEMEARFAKLQATVADLQRAQPPLTAAPSGSETPRTIPAHPFFTNGAIHGQFGHGEGVSTGGFPAVTTTSPLVPPVTGTHSLQQPMTNSEDT